MSRNATHPHRILIVGGGIGGLTAAIALRQIGADVEVVEIRTNWSVTGWGLSLTGPALRALASVGLTEACLELGYGITQIANCDMNGAVLDSVDLPRLLGAGKPSQAGIARGDLARTLRHAAVRQGAELRVGTTLEAIHHTPDGARVTLSDGDERDVDLVVVADGVNSKTRGLLGFAVSPTYIGQMVWRAIVPRPSWADRLLTFFGPGDNAGLIPISADRAYCFVTENTDDSSAIPDERLAEAMRERLAPFGGRVSEIRDSIQSADLVVRRPAHILMTDLPWNRGHAVLLGDAAHTPSPQLVSGAALAIEDAVVLAEELAADDDALAALGRYGKRRFERAELVVDASVGIAELEQAGRQSEVPAVLGRAHGALAASI